MKESVWMMWDPVDAKRLIWVYINNTRGECLAAARTLLGQTAAFRYIKYFLDQWKIFCIFTTSLAKVLLLGV